MITVVVVVVVMMEIDNNNKKVVFFQNPKKRMPGAYDKMLKGMGLKRKPIKSRKPRGKMTQMAKYKGRAKRHGIYKAERRILLKMKGEVNDLSKKRRYLPDMRKYYSEAIKKAKVRVSKKPIKPRKSYAAA